VLEKTEKQLESFSISEICIMVIKLDSFSCKTAVIIVRPGITEEHDTFKYRYISTDRMTAISCLLKRRRPAVTRLPDSVLK